MKKVCFILTLFLFLAGSMSSAGAYSILLSPVGSYDASAGEALTFEVLFTAGADESLSLSGYTFNLGYDASELTFVSSSADLLGFETLLGDALNVEVDGNSYIVNFNQYISFDATPLELSAGETVVLGTFTFEATDSLLSDGLSDLWLAGEVLVGDLTYSSLIIIDDSDVDLLPLVTAQGADVSTVPVPGAVWMLGAGLLGLTGIKRKNYSRN